ncbi:DUF6221 family protein [Streptomyces maoxianensis]|uniref:DUF6221 family protein n=1 Tax=Streptomyces maoxianensis TaxID=1459942 RepID=A0ABV9G9I1_9ACTN
MRDDFWDRVEFLDARLREDEKAAEALKSSKNDAVAELRARVLADVKAKRRLVCWALDRPWEPEDRPRAVWQDALVNAIADIPRGRRRPVIDHLVAAYDGHRDFHPAWRLVEDEPEDEPGGDKVRTRTRGRTV